MRRATDIDREAATWVARIDRDTDEGNVTAFSRWLSQSDQHRGAFVRAQAMLHVLDAQPATAEVLPAAAPAPQPSRRILMVGALAASLVAGLWLRGSSGSAIRLATAPGRVRRFALGDGSLLVLNGGSLAEVRFRAGERHVRLAGGEGWVQVAHDRRRPFVFEAGGLAAVAVGTAFSLGHADGGIELIVTEGAVEARFAGATQRVQAGCRAVVGADGTLRSARLAAGELDRRIAWTRGEIVLSGETLAAAVDRFNAANTARIAVDDPALAASTLLGRFSINDPAGFARAAAISLDAAVVPRAGVLYIVPGDKRSPARPTG